MTYDLAKQLKDAGFPQDEKDHTGQHWIDEICSYDHPTGDKNECLIPTLSELIEACGKRFRSLGYIDISEEWTALAFISAVINDDKYSHMKQGKGKIPEEAVAKLWLALNAK
jgi:hypothetical protein